MNKTKISIITPIYNAQEYLTKCINSICSQTFSDWELILVNDGSTDNSPIMCNQYTHKDSRIRVIHKTNAGVSAARQTGLEQAKGEYIIQVDPDDWIETKMLEDLYNKAIKENADVVICDYYSNLKSKQIYIKQAPSSLQPEAVLKDLFKHLHGSCCNKLIKRNCYKLYSISFPPEINYCEDLITWIQLFQHKEIKIAYHPFAYYHYVIHDNSITNKYTRATYNMRQKYIDLLIKILPSEGYEYEIRKSKAQVLFEGCMNNVLSAQEAQNEVWKNKKYIFCENHNIKWIIGFFLILIGLYSHGQKFFKY